MCFIDASQSVNEKIGIVMVLSQHRTQSKRRLRVRKPCYFLGGILTHVGLQLRLQDQCGTILSHRNSDIISIHSSVEAIWSHLEDALNEMLRDVSTEAPINLVSLALGLEGLVSNQMRRRLTESAPEFYSLELASQVHMAIIGTTSGESGIGIHLGQTLFAQSFDENHHSTRIGGWGFPFDVASSPWLGQQALNQLLKLIDGLPTQTNSDSFLYQAIFDYCGGSKESVTEWLRKNERNRYGELGELVIDFANKKDVEALRLIEAGIQGIIGYVEKLDRQRELPIVLTGTIAPLLQPFFPEWLRQLVHSDSTASLKGAIAVAQEKSYREVCVEPQISWEVQSSTRLQEKMLSLKPDEDSSTPLYIQIKNKFTLAIRNGLWGPGNSLPSERILAEALGVSRITVRKTIELLLTDGLVERHQGAGTFVKERVEQPISILKGFSDEMRARGFKPDTQILESFVRAASPEEAITLSLKPGDEVTYLKRLRLANGKPIAVEYSVLPKKVLPNPFSVKKSLYSTLKSRNCMPVRALQHLRANIVSGTERDLLEATDETPVLYITRIGYLDDGKPIELTHSYYRGDRYDFIAELQNGENQAVKQIR